MVTVTNNSVEAINAALLRLQKNTDNNIKNVVNNIVTSSSSSGGNGGSVTKTIISNEKDYSEDIEKINKDLDSNKKTISSVSSKVNGFQNSIDSNKSGISQNTAAIAELTRKVNMLGNGQSVATLTVNDGVVVYEDNYGNKTEFDATTLGAILLSEKAKPEGIATLDQYGKVPASQLPSSIMEYKGTWDASTNTPSISDGMATADVGDVYICNVEGKRNLGSGEISFAVGDWVMYNGSIWERSSSSNLVKSVNGKDGVITLTASDVGALPYSAVGSLDANTALDEKLYVVAAGITNAAIDNHSALLNIKNLGTPFQLQIPDSIEDYVYKRSYSGGVWSGWRKLKAGNADIVKHDGKSYSWYNNQHYNPDGSIFDYYDENAAFITQTSYTGWQAIWQAPNKDGAQWSSGLYENNLYINRFTKGNSANQPNQQWIFEPNGDFTAPGNIYVGSGAHQVIHSGGGTFTGKVYGDTGNGLEVQSKNSGAWTEGIRIYDTNEGYSVLALMNSDATDVLAMVHNGITNKYYIETKVDNGTNNIINIPNKSGTFALLSDLPNVSNFISNAGASPNLGDGTVVTQPNGSDAAISIRTTNGGSRDAGIFYLSQDSAYVANSADSGYAFGVFDTDRTANMSSVDTASFAVLQNMVGSNMAGVLTITPTTGNYTEGIRIKPYSSWSTILLGGNDLTSDTGTSPNSWSIHNNNGNFYISRGGSNSSPYSMLSCENNNWRLTTSLSLPGLNVGNRVTDTLPDSGYVDINRVTLYPPYHTGGPWNVNIYDNSSSSYLRFLYGDSEQFYLRHDGELHIPGFFFRNSDIAEDDGNLSNTSTAHTMSLYRNGISIPYQMDNPNDGGILRCRGTTENNVIFEMATWDDSGDGETIQFNYYPTTSRSVPTHSVTVPKKSGTIALTSDIPTSLPANGGSAASASSVSNTGTGINNFTWYQTSDTFQGATGWASYLISNHGDGATYYNQIIRMPFWGAPQYQRMTDGTLSGWIDFITSENISSQSVSYAASAGGVAWDNVSGRPSSLPANGGNADTLDGRHDSGFMQVRQGHNVGSWSTSLDSLADGYSSCGMTNGGGPFGTLWTHYINIGWNNGETGTWNSQIAFCPQDASQPMMWRTNGASGSWRTVIDSENIGNQSVNKTSHIPTFQVDTEPGCIWVS